MSCRAGMAYAEADSPLDTLNPHCGRPPAEADAAIAAVLTALRKHLGLDVGFISEFLPDRRRIRFVTADATQTVVCPGMEIPLSEGYCQRIVDGRLPELMADASLVPEATAIEFTASVPVGVHLGVPIRLASGELYGTLCCFGPMPRPDLRPRDLEVMRAFAEILAGPLSASRAAEMIRNRDRAVIEGALAGQAPNLVFQPIVDLLSGRALGLEGLSRFTLPPVRPPDEWFAAAEAVGLGVELELSAVRNAIALFARIPEPLYLSLNCSPALIRSGHLAAALAGTPLSRVVLEVTEHSMVDDFEQLQQALAPMRAVGVRLAMDDAGAGFSSLQHLMQLRPELIKLDLTLARVVDRDLTTRALVAALVTFANETGSQVVAEGVEDLRAARAYQELGVHGGQGYYFAHPLPLEEARRGLAQ